jgi:hypothetical protein
LQIRVSLENRKQMFGLMIWAWPDGIVAQVSFKPTAPHASPTRDRGAALRCVPARPASHRPAVADVQDRDHSLSLSSDYKEENAGRSFLFPVTFPPTPRWVPPSTHRRLATVWLRHWAIPHTQLILISLRFFCPRSQHHPSTPPLATLDHVDNCRHHR